MPISKNVFTRPTINNDTKATEIQPTILKGSLSIDPISNEIKLEKKIESLEMKLNKLKAEHSILSKDLDINSTITNADYNKEMQKHIRQLKTYNDLKDLSMKLIQVIADQRQLTLRAIMNEMGIEDDK